MYQRSQEETLERKKGKEKTEKGAFEGEKPDVLDTLMYHSLDCLIHVLLEITN